MLPEVLARLEAACARAGRRPDEVRLVAVTKGRTPAEIERSVLAFGHRRLGENRAQELRDKRPHLPEDVEWHFIGNLQTNKVKYLSGVTLIHSLNSRRLADALARRAELIGESFDVLIEVNVAGETAKQGVPVADLEELADHTRALAGVRLVGLMGMAPFSPDPEAARPVFAALRRLGERLGLPELSMGMSGDFEVAAEEGATLVRVGTALFPASGQ